jgi:hypothetical protein
VNALAKDLEGSSRGLIFKVPSWNLPGGTEEKPLKPLVMISSLWAEILTQDLPNIK